ncbi:hypothetical protein HPB50_002143 [Hyalomma asiaticum]|uniref:Uncharacterized protein n=1 Tax=Hyalomma asiaticum TaxID=266040 RepID=A0ACB7RLI8_HYAAI|nr:hypothetical protein HPB50_002143 [Hyalomma asiaticum]
MTHRCIKNQGSRCAHSPTLRSNANMIPQCDDSHTARRPPDITKPAVNKTTTTSSRRPSMRTSPAGNFRDYVSADNGVAVCSAVSLDNIIEAVRPDSTDTSDE